MDLEQPHFVPRPDIEALRGGRLAAVRFNGLYVAGSLACLRGISVAVVGTRAPSSDARMRAHRLGESLARAGICVVSGLALGIDGAAHAGALAGGGATVGILGGGHRCFFPRRNRGLAVAMLGAGGAVVSPFGLDHPCRPAQFLQRNGIVAALADAVVVVEAAARSGALNTATWAADGNIPVMAFPGDVERPKAAGCNALLRDGAILVRDAHDVLTELGVQTDPPRPLPDTPMLPFRSEFQERLIDAVHRQPCDADALITLTGRPASDVLTALGHLAISGVIARGDDGRYRRT